MRRLDDEDRPMARRKLTRRDKLDVLVSMVDDEGRFVVDAGSFDDDPAAPPPAKRGPKPKHDWQRIDAVVDFFRARSAFFRDENHIPRTALIQQLRKWCMEETGTAPHTREIERRWPV
jgi:hypothetical protein